MSKTLTEELVEGYVTIAKACLGTYGDGDCIATLVAGMLNHDATVRLTRVISRGTVALEEYLQQAKGIKLMEEE